MVFQAIISILKLFLEMAKVEFKRFHNIFRSTVAPDAKNLPLTGADRLVNVRSFIWLTNSNGAFLRTGSARRSWTVQPQPGVALMPLPLLKRIVLACLLAALTGVGAVIAIPIGPVPIVLTNLFVLLAGLLLGSRWAMAAMGLYLLVGLLGFPVFAGAGGGMAHLIGPTGGYLFGFVVAGGLTGLIAETGNKRLTAQVIAVLLGSLAIYAIGVPWLKMATQMSWVKAIAVGALPFLPGDVVKAVAALSLARALKPILERQLGPAAA